MDHRYFVYGVSLSSDIPFDFPSEAPATQDGPHVRFARATDSDFEEPSRGESSGDEWFVCRELEDESIYLRWSGLYEFRIDPSGACVRYRPLREGDPAVLQNFLFGQTLSFALVRQNVEPIHAAVVDVDGLGIALLGDCTYGKSTLAGSLLRAGCRLVTDDVLVAHEAEGRVMARAGAGRIKLLPDSARAILRDVSSGVRLMANADKRVFRLHGDMVQRKDVPLRAFVVLPTPEERDTCDRIEIRPMTGVHLLPELVKNTFVRHLHGRRRLRQNFSWNAHLASAVDGYRLRYPSGIDRLPSVADAIVGHFRSHSQRSPR
jgi:hypothetical protein